MAQTDRVYAKLVNLPSFSTINRKRRHRDGFSWAVMLTVLCIFAFVTSFSTASFAQTSSTEGAIIGSVTDSTGAAIPGAIVTLTGAKVMGPTKVTAGSDGQYKFPALQPGEYSVSASHEGFAVGQVKSINVGLGFTATVPISLPAGSVEQVVSVDASGTSIDTQSQNVTTRLSTAALEELPGSRDFWAVIAQAPAIAVGRVDVGGSNALTQQSSITYGLTSGSGVNRGMVEGVMVNEGAGGSSEMYYTDFGALAEMSVNAAGNNAEMPNPGVLTQLIVKSGGNQYHGNVYYDYENDSLEGANIDANQIALGVKGSNVLSVYDTNRISKFSDFNADLGGFIVKDKLWWYGAFRYTSVGQRYPTLIDDTQVTTSPVWTGKINYDINGKQKIIGFYQHSAKVQPDYLGAILISGARASPALMGKDTVWSSSFPTYVWKAEYDYTITNNLLLEARVGQYHSDWDRHYKSSDARIEDTSSNYVYGGVYNSENKRSRPQFSGSVVWAHSGWLGSHSFKFGGEYMRDTITQPAGLFGSSCQCVSQLVAGAPTQVTIYQANISINGNSTIGVYAQDTWNMTRRLNVNLGVRFDHNNLFNPEQTGADGTKYAAVSSAFHFNNVGPRIGFDYDVFGNHKTVVKSSFGQYFVYPGSDYAGNFNPNTAGGWKKVYQWTNTTITNGGGTPCGGTVATGDVPTCHWDGNSKTLGNLVSSAGGVNTISIDPNLKNTYTLQGTMFVEREVVPNFTVRTGFVWNGRRDVAASIYPTRPLSAYILQPNPFYIPGPTAGSACSTDCGYGSYSYYDLPTPVTAAVAQTHNIHASSNYYSWEISGAKRSGKIDVLASYARTWSYETTLGATNAYTPNAQLGAPGFTNSFYTWQAKVNLTYRAPYGIRLIPVMTMQSGTPFARTFTRTMNYGSTTFLAESFG